MYDNHWKGRSCTQRYMLSPYFFFNHNHNKYILFIYLCICFAKSNCSPWVALLRRSDTNHVNSWVDQLFGGKTPRFKSASCQRGLTRRFNPLPNSSRINMICHRYKYIVTITLRGAAPTQKIIRHLMVCKKKMYFY